MIRIRLRQDYTDLLRHASKTLSAAFEANERYVDAPIIELSWRVEPHSRRGLNEWAKNFLLNLIGEEQRLREGALQLKVQALDEASGNLSLFDLLKDKLVSTQKVIPADDRHRSVDHVSMFRAIESAYEGLYADLLSATAMEDDRSD